MDLDNYYLKFSEPIQGCLFALRSIILEKSKEIREGIKYRIPFFYHKEQKFCFLWVRRKEIVFGVIEDRIYQKQIEGVKTKDKMEVLYLDPSADLPIKKIEQMLAKTMKRHK